MTGSSALPSIETLKDQARGLRAEQASGGAPITHSQSLEMLAHRYGYKDWNTLRAAASESPPPAPVNIGDRVRGQYLGQLFTGEVIELEALTPPGRFRVALHFDEPVDVVTFDSFSSFRQRVSCTVDTTGKTVEKTSDGRPQMQVEVCPIPG